MPRKKEETKEDLQNKIRGLRIANKKWQNECRELRANLMLIKAQVFRISENIVIKNLHDRSSCSIRYYNGGKYSQTKR
jgi:hypothetical protein